MEKYYTPDIEDLYIGYECEIFERLAFSPEKIWQKYICGDTHCAYDESFDPLYQQSVVLVYENNTPWVRTKYLDKSDIESLGWNHTGGQLMSVGRKDFETKFHLLQFYCARVDNIGLSTIKIMTKEDDFVMGSYRGYDRVLYDGECKSINELKKIMQWFNIKNN